MESKDEIMIRHGELIPFTQREIVLASVLQNLPQFYRHDIKQYLEVRSPDGVWEDMSDAVSAAFNGKKIPSTVHILSSEDLIITDLFHYQCHVDDQNKLKGYLQGPVNLPELRERILGKREDLDRFLKICMLSVEGSAEIILSNIPVKECDRPHLAHDMRLREMEGLKEDNRAQRLELDNAKLDIALLEAKVKVLELELKKANRQ